MDAAKEPAKEPATDASSAPVQAASPQAAEAHRPAPKFRACGGGTDTL